MSDIITQADVERRIIILTDTLDEQTALYAEVSEQRAEAEADYKYAFSRAMVAQAGKVPVATKEAHAHLRSPDAYRLWKVLEARERATQHKLTSVRSQLDALRTIAANVRSLTR
jgi:hypothetical protein